MDCPRGNPTVFPLVVEALGPGGRVPFSSKRMEVDSCLLHVLLCAGVPLPPFPLPVISVSTPQSPIRSFHVVFGLCIPSFIQHVSSACCVPYSRLGGGETKIKSLFDLDVCAGELMCARWGLRSC